MPKRVHLRIVASTRSAAQVSIRTMEGGMDTHLRDELKAAGFKAGDLVTIVPRAEADAVARVQALLDRAHGQPIAAIDLGAAIRGAN